MGKTITEIMIGEHGKIDSMTEEVEKLSAGDLGKAREAFNKFKWNLEKHFFVEEKVVFNAYNSVSEDSEDAFRILKEHKDLLWSVKKIEEALSGNARPDFSGIKKELRAHADFEDKIFYPKLDEQLSDELKEVVKDRAGEIIKG